MNEKYQSVIPPGEPAIRVTMLPRDTNESGTIFGGIILSYIDLAAAIEARKHTVQKIVTVAMHEVVFVAPVYIGDLVSFYTETVKIGRSSVTVKVVVEANRRFNSDKVRVTEAEVVYVAVDSEGKPAKIERLSA